MDFVFLITALRFGTSFILCPETQPLGLFLSVLCTSLLECSSVADGVMLVECLLHYYICLSIITFFCGVFTFFYRHYIICMQNMLLPFPFKCPLFLSMD